MALLSSFVNRTLPDTPGCPLPLVEQAILDSIKEFIDKTWVVSEGFSVSVATANGGVGTLNLSGIVPTNHKIVSIKSFRQDGVDYELYEWDLANEGVANLDTPTSHFYYQIPGNNTLLVYPTAVGEIFHGEVICIPKDAATEVDDILYDEWVEPIVAGAKARLFAMPDKKWTNYELVANCQLEARRGMVRANRKRNKSRTNKSLVVKPRSFFDA